MWCFQFLLVRYLLRPVILNFLDVFNSFSKSGIFNQKIKKIKEALAYL